jgi:Myb DNA-binding like
MASPLGGSPRGGGDGDEGLDDDLGRTEPSMGLPPDIRDITLKDILSRVQGGKKSGLPMPSTVQRRNERLKRKREDRARARAEAVAAAETAATTATATQAATQSASGTSVGGTAVTAVAGASAIGAAVTDAEEESAETGRAAKRTAVSAAADVSSVAPTTETAEVDTSGPFGLTAGNDDGGSDDGEQGSAQPTVVAPKVTIDDDGNIVIDKESLVVSATATSSAELDQARLVLVDNNAITRHITSATFSRRDPAQKWEADDDEKFFHALSRFGTDFSLIEHVFPTRTRRQIKLKFKREERKNRARVDACLKTRTSINITDARKQFGLTGAAPDPLVSPVAPMLSDKDVPGDKTHSREAEAIGEAAPVTPPPGEERIDATPVEANTNEPVPNRVSPRQPVCESSDDDDDDDEEEGNENDICLRNPSTDATSAGVSLGSGIGVPLDGVQGGNSSGLAAVPAAAHTVVVENDDDMDDFMAHQQY